MGDIPRDAATILPLREAGQSLEVFMVKRHSAMGFLGGAHVFPGGAVDERDRDGRADALFGGLDLAAGARTLELADDLPRARGLFVAAIRELFEEAGILLAYDADGKWVDLRDGSRRAQEIGTSRPLVAAGEQSLLELLEAHGLRLAVDRLAYFAHWVTPKQERKRFDTRFFLVHAPGGQVAEHDRSESIEGDWIRPAAALERYRAHEIGMVPPTIASLERLARQPSVEAAISEARARRVVVVRPKLSMRDDEFTLLYPGDADYESGTAQAAREGRELDRLILRDGLWWRP